MDHAILIATRWKRNGPRNALSALMTVVPAHPQALVHGLDSEENSLVAAIYLARHYSGQVTLLCENTSNVHSYLDTLGAGTYLANGVIQLQQRSPLSDIFHLLRAELVLYTHGLLGSPVPRGLRYHVNLWHGNAPKRTVNSLVPQHVGADALCGPSRVWARTVKEDLNMSPAATLICGGPRLGSLRSVILQDRAQVWSRLGLEPQKKTVLWMPTFRKTDRVAAIRLSEGSSVLSEADSKVAEQRNLLIQFANANSIQLVVKPHPLDAENPAFGSARVLTNDQIWGAGVSLYQFLGLIDGMISDYSSVWVDCLGLKYPIGLFCPDLEEYRESRGLAEPHIDVVASSLMLESQSRMDEFFKEVNNGPGRFVADAQEVAATLECRFPDDVETAFITELRDAIQKTHPNSQILDRLRPPRSTN